MRTQDELHHLTREVLGDDYVELAITKYTLTENIAEGSAWIVCQLRDPNHGQLRGVEGRGVGFIDALFSGIKNALMSDYPSLGHIHFVSFQMSGDFKAVHGLPGAHSDAPGTVRLTIENSTNREFTFESTSPSVSASSVAAVVKGVEHFVNAELAVLRVFDWIEDARTRSRPDLAEKYIQRLADLVQNSSYSETIERKKAAVIV